MAATRNCAAARLSVSDRGAGKGTNVLRMLQYAAGIGAAQMVMLDADLRSAQPEWISLMLSAVSQPGPALATPIYRRNRFEGNTTSHRTGPLMRAVFGVDFQQPIAGDFAFNRGCIEQALTWRVPASAQLYGIDMWPTSNAALNRVVLAFLFQHGFELRRCRLPVSEAAQV
jgi:glucosylglycerate synthase